MRANNFTSTSVVEVRKEEKERKTREGTTKAKLEKACIKLKEESGVPKEATEQIMAIFDRTHRRYLSPTHRDNMLCAIIMVGCQVVEKPVTIKESQTAVGITTRLGCLSVKKINQEKRRLQRKLKIGIAPSNAVDYIDRWCEKIGLNKEIAAEAKEIANIETEGISPPGKAIAAINITTNKFGQKISPQKLAKITGISVSTVKIVSKKLERGANASLFFENLLKIGKVWQDSSGSLKISTAL